VALNRNLPHLLKFAHDDQEIFMRSVVEAGASPRSAGAPISSANANA
jgi:hypothetical protein